MIGRRLDEHLEIIRHPRAPDHRQRVRRHHHVPHSMAR
jgi:hypothetical protein